MAKKQLPRKPGLDEAVAILQGADDQYGTMRQVEIAQEECYCPVDVTVVPAGHSPHREAPEATLHAPGRVGGLTPLASTSAGRALVLDLPDDELRALGLAAHAAAIAEARSRGYALVREEFEPGLVAAAAPVRDVAGRVVAALNVSAPRFRFDDRLEAAAGRVVAAADALTAAAAR